MALNTWNTTRELEDEGRREDTGERSNRDQTPFRTDKRKKVDLHIMALYTINLEEVGKD